MPYEIDYLEEEGGVITTYWGVVTDEEIIQSGREKGSQQGRIDTIRYALTDLSRVESFNVTPAGVQENAHISSDILKKNNKILVAFIFPTDLEHGLGRVWQAYANHTDAESRIFKTRSEAEHWIKTELQHREKDRP